MVNRNASKARRCPNCMVHKENCFCEQISPIELQTRISIILYKKEKNLPSNTAHLATKALINSNVFERGYRDLFVEEDFIDSTNYHPLYLFPSDDAVELTSELISNIDKPINLIVPDGSWRQAQKVHRRAALLKDIPRVKLSLEEKTQYLLRRQKTEFGLCTFEAIAYALREIEGGDINVKLMNYFKIFQDAHLVNRDIFVKEKKRTGYS